MKYLEDQAYLIGYLFFNAFALLTVIAAIKWPKVARWMFALLFVWASVTNWTIVLRTPQVYLDYAELAFFPFYRHFIQGWFSGHIVPIVGFIATAQALIGISMLLKGWIFWLGALGAIVFLLAIVPLGIGSGFPCTFIMAIAVFLLMRHPQSFIWQKPIGGKHQFSAA